MHACMYACIHVCKHACMYLNARTCVFVCASVHTGLRACVCARAGVCACMCTRAGVGSCTTREECACVVSVPASSPPWKPSVGLACMPCSYFNSGAPGAAASEHLAVEPLAAIEP